MVDSRLHRTALRAGVAVSALLLLVGSVIKLGAGEHAAPAVRLLRLGEVVTLGDFLATLGIVALIALPLLRLVGLVVAWIRQGDRRYAAVAVAVGLLLVSAPLLAR